MQQIILCYILNNFPYCLTLIIINPSYGIKPYKFCVVVTATTTSYLLSSEVESRRLSEHLTVPAYSWVPSPLPPCTPLNSNQRCCTAKPERDNLQFYFSWKIILQLTKMSDLAWAVKNGDLDQVKELVDKKVNYLDWYFMTSLLSININNIHGNDIWRDLMWMLTLTEDCHCTMPVTTASWRSSNISVPRYLAWRWRKISGQPQLMYFCFRERIWMLRTSTVFPRYWLVILLIMQFSDDRNLFHFIFSCLGGSHELCQVSPGKSE